ncbi:MAG: low-specificity L-threonine aldolase [Ardenticatenales bacterium]|nr:low-specificity L-threonine aldolase [Ardenticatenales bacterium]
MAVDGIVDLRSDTLTRPTPAMRAAMAAADVGDDVFGEDPTVNRLERQAAETMGKAAGLFMPSGTMGNLAALLAHCGRGDEAIVGDEAHTFYYEAGGMAALGGIQPRTLPNRPDGTLDITAVEAAIRTPNVHFPVTRLICLENTHNRCGGAVLDAAYMRAVRAVADAHGLAVHLDGARIFNAAVALGVPVSALAADADSVTFCLSKGLAAPVGSVLCGTAAFIDTARRARKQLGGGMRQAGVLAAAGLVALDTMVDRLADDHANARRLAEGLAGLRGVTPAPDAGRTNIVVAALDRADIDVDALVERMAGEGVRFFGVGGNRFRLVTHWEVTADDVERALAAFRQLLG